MIFCSGHGYAVGMDVTFNVILLFFLFQVLLVCA